MVPLCFSGRLDEDYISDSSGWFQECDIVSFRIKLGLPFHDAKHDAQMDSSFAISLGLFCSLWMMVHGIPEHGFLHVFSCFWTSLDLDRPFSVSTTNISD